MTIAVIRPRLLSEKLDDLLFLMWNKNHLIFRVCFKLNCISLSFASLLVSSRLFCLASLRFFGKILSFRVAKISDLPPLACQRIDVSPSQSCTTLIFRTQNSTELKFELNSNYFWTLVRTKTKLIITELIFIDGLLFVYGYKYRANQNCNEQRLGFWSFRQSYLNVCYSK